jgi:hypothetical protein
MILLLVFALLLFAVGIALIVPALKCRTKTCPPFAQSSVRMKYIRPFWKIKDWFTPRGYKLYLWGTICWCTGALLCVIYYSIKCFHA